MTITLKLNQIESIIKEIQSLKRNLDKEGQFRVRSGDNLNASVYLTLSNYMETLEERLNKILYKSPIDIPFHSISGRK